MFWKQVTTQLVFLGNIQHLSNQWHKLKNVSSVQRHEITCTPTCELLHYLASAYQLSTSCLYFRVSSSCKQLAFAYQLSLSYLSFRARPHARTSLQHASFSSSCKDLSSFRQTTYLSKLYPHARISHLPTGFH